MVKLDIISDPICPWCFIGWHSLARAMESRPNHAFDIEWHPFQLNPDMPPQGMDRRDYLETKFGGRDGALRAYTPIAERAEAMGLNINFEGITRTPNTLNAHRVLHWAGLEGRQTPMKTALFRGYFQQGRDIGDVVVLADLAEQAGLDRDMITRLLASDADADDIRARDAHARARGVSGVPTFIVANQHALSGAQSADLWMQVIDDIAAQLAQK
jgi:predicted DsbA family dithiol-disulfide isomerase